MTIPAERETALSSPTYQRRVSLAVRHRQGIRQMAAGYWLGCLALAALTTGCASTATIPTEVIDVSPKRWESVIRARGLEPADVPMPMGQSAAIEAFARQTAGTGSDREKLT